MNNAPKKGDRVKLLMDRIWAENMGRVVTGTVECVERDYNPFGRNIRVRTDDGATYHVTADEYTPA